MIQTKSSKEPFDSLLCKYQTGLERSMRGSDFISDYVSEMYYVCKRITMNCGESYINSPKWIEN